MPNTSEVTIPVEPEAAAVLRDPARRVAAGVYLSRVLRDERVVDLLAEAIRTAKQEAHGNGLTDEIIDAELAAWRLDRSV